MKTTLANNCTREEALTHFGFTYVGRKSIRGNRYSKCYYHEKMQIFAVPFDWRTTFHKFMSRDKVTQKVINKKTTEMWYGIDVIENFKRLSEKLDAIEAFIKKNQLTEEEIQQEINNYPEWDYKVSSKI